MTELGDDETYFYVTQIKPPYPVRGLKSYSLDHIWAGEKCWFMKGDHVIIKDSNGNMKEFVKE